MFNVVKKEIEWAGRKLVLETGKIARQADGAVLASYGQTIVLCTVVAKKQVNEGVDFFPLTVNYQEKAFAAGKIPGGFFKREGRPSEKEVLVSRLIDRPIRPLFPDGFYNETQVICTVLSHDLENDPDVVAIIGASAALAIAGLPFDGPVAAARVGYINGEYVLNPLTDQLVDSALDLVVAGTGESVLMVESEAKMLSEETMLGAVDFGHKAMQPVIKLIKELKDSVGKPSWDFKKADYSNLAKQIADLAESGLRDAYKETVKQVRSEKIANVKDAASKALQEKLGDEYKSNVIGSLFKDLEKNIVRSDVLKNKKRIDGRGQEDIRNIETEVGLFPKTHGSALFTRGETQVIAVVTLGTGQDVQIVDALDGEYKEPFMLHYNFPPYSVGEASMLKSPGRREIGHGKLAWRAIRATIPNQEEFRYTIRIVSEVTESNGSSSMATVCGSSLAMMDAGVPLKSPVAGIAMGLIKEGSEFVVLSDILGDEDHLGDMDFKVAGTEEGVTALQMDIKINGITTEIMGIALDQAKRGRHHILGRMSKTLSSARDAISQNAPQVVTIKIDKEKIGALIGPGGKVIREICETTGAKVDIEEDGSVHISAVGNEAIENALKMVQDVVVEVEMGKIYEGSVVRLLDFGALVNFLGKTDGLVHISELIDERVESVEDIVKIGDKVKVKVIGMDRGKIRLSMRRVNQETGEDLSSDSDSDTSYGGGSGGGRSGKPGGGGNRRPSHGGGRGGDRDRSFDDRGNSNKSSSSEKSGDDDQSGNKKRRFF